MKTKCLKSVIWTKPTTTQARTRVIELAHPPCLWSAGACEGTGPADPKLQDLHDTGQQQDTQEESSEGPISVV